MPTRLQVGRDLVVHPLNGNAPPRQVPESRRVHRFLRVHPEDQHVEQQLRVTLRLHRPAHEPEGQEGLAVPGDEARDDRVEGPFARGDLVRVPVVDHESGAPVLQREAQPRNDDSRPEPREHRVDERDHVAVGVGDREVDRLGVGDRAAGVDSIGGDAGVDQAAARVHEAGAQQRHRVDLHVLGVRDVPVQVGEGQLLHLDQVVEVVGGVVPHPLEVHRLQQLEHLQRRDPLPRRRQLPNRVAPEVRAQRLDPARLVRGQVFQREEPAQRRQPVHQLAAQRPAVEHAGALVGDPLEGARQVRVREPLTRMGGPFSVDQVGRAGPLVTGQLFGRARPLARDHRRHGKAFARDPDRGCQHLRQIQLAVAGHQRVPPGDRTRHRDGFGPAPRHSVMTSGAERLHRHPAAAPAAGVDAHQLAGLRQPHDREGVAAHTGHVRFHDVQHRGRRDRAVDRVSALPHDLEGGGGGEWLARRRDHPGRVDGGTATHVVLLRVSVHRNRGCGEE